MSTTTRVDMPERDRELRILIVRLSAIGDVFMTSPVAQAIKEAYPRAHLTWLVEPVSASFVKANPYVDEVLIFDRKGEWKRLLREWRLPALLRDIRDFGAGLRAHHFDIALDFQGLFKSGLLARISAAPRRIGYAASDEMSRIFYTEKVAVPRHPTHLSDYYLYLLTALGIAPTPRRPILTLSDAVHDAARDFLASRGLVAEPYAACCVSSSRPQKDWVWSRWSELADLLWEREGLRTVFVGGPERRVDALALVESCQARPVSAVGYTSLVESAALVQDAALVIGTDTGLTYTGLATDTPTIALYGSTDPNWLAEEPQTAVCFHPMPCNPCMRRPSCAHYDCMQAIDVQEVADTAARLLKHCRVPA